MPTLRDPAADVPVVARPDVLVVGGGAAGIAAATAAARAGADVMLLERYGYLGGLATGGLVILLLTLDDGRGNQVVFGLCQELVERLEAAGAALRPHSHEWGSTDPELVERYRRWGLIWGPPPGAVRYSVAFDPDAFKHVADTMLLEAGVRLRFHTWFARPLVAERRITGVVVESKAGREAIVPAVVVDASGDGDVLARAGAGFERVDILPWLWFRMGNVQRVDDAIQAGAGRFFQALGGRFFHTLGQGRTLMPWGAADSLGRKIDPLDPDAFSAAEVELRAKVLDQARRLREAVPGFEDAYLHDMATQMGITESRRLLGRYRLTKDDAGAGFPDTVARTGHWTKYGVVYDVPFRALTTDAVRNLVVAGRCISVDRPVHQATKEIPAAMATGEAAGAAAALAASDGVDVDAIDVGRLQDHLRSAGALRHTGG